MDIDGPEALDGLMRSYAGADRHAIVNSDDAPVAGDDEHDDDIDKTPLENGDGDGDEEDTLLPLLIDDDDDRDLPLLGRGGVDGGRDGAVVGVSAFRSTLQSPRWVHSTLSC